MRKNENVFNNVLNSHIACILRTGETYTHSEEMKNAIIEWFNQHNYNYEIRYTQTFAYNIKWS